ncbi:hypothetical protein ACU61A_12560 [Pseudonocardia sichuanensis]
MSTTPPPLDREPRSVRPPFDVRDDRFEHLHATDPEAWRRAVHLDRLSAVLEPLDGIELSEREHAAAEPVPALAADPARVRHGSGSPRPVALPLTCGRSGVPG